MSLANPQTAGEIVTTTLRSRTGKAADNVTKNTALLMRLRKKGNVKPVTGGRTIMQEIGKRLADLDLLLHKQLKDVDPGKAITYFLREPVYVQNNVSKNRDFKKYIENMSKELNKMKEGKRKNKKTQVVKALQDLPEKYKKLVQSIRVFYDKKKVYGLRLKIENGPANHNSLSNRSLQNLLSFATKNNSTLKGLGPSSLFMAFLDNALKEHGGTARGKCGGFRGTIDKSLLRRRVVFKSVVMGNEGVVPPSSLSALKRGLAAINHGRLHILKTQIHNGNITVGVPRNMSNAKKYLEAMASKHVRNSKFFMENYTRNNNTLYYLQVDAEIHLPVRLTRDGSALEPFDPNTMDENKEVLWTSYGLQLNEKSGGKFDFFDFIKYVYTGNESGPSKIIKNVTGKGISGGDKIFVIQMDSRTTEFLHKKYYYDPISNTDYVAQVKQILTSCNTGMNMDINTPAVTARPGTARKRPATARGKGQETATSKQKRIRTGSKTPATAQSRTPAATARTRVRSKLGVKKSQGSKRGTRVGLTSIPKNPFSAGFGTPASGTGSPMITN